MVGVVRGGVRGGCEGAWRRAARGSAAGWAAVSYTHLDVYKRQQLEAALTNFAAKITDATGRDDTMRPGAGAAGGVGYAAMAVLGARMRPGIDVVLELGDFTELLPGADLVVTGEGALDLQTCLLYTSHRLAVELQPQRVVDRDLGELRGVVAAAPLVGHLAGDARDGDHGPLPGGDQRRQQGLGDRHGAEHVGLEHATIAVQVGVLDPVRPERPARVVDQEGCLLYTSRCV